MDKARLFRNGRNQAVRIPRRYEFRCKRVIIRPHGRGLLLLPEEDPVEEMFAGAEAFTEDYMRGGREQGEYEEREPLE